MPRVAVLALVVSLALLASISDALRSGGTEAARGSAASTGVRGATTRYRFIINSSSDPRAVAANGWNLIDVGSKWAADRVPAGTKGLIWVGDYDNAACAWDISDSSLTDQIKAIARDPKVAGYFFSDEPDPDVCPKAPTQHRARSKLIHSLDPGKLAVMVMDANSGQASLRQIPLWVGTADYVGLDPYPCYQGKPCDYPWIDTIIKGANRAQLSYWGVVQAFSDSTWRWPTTP